MYKSFFKRAIDILFSGCAIIILSPIMLITALLIHLKLGSPVIFKQERPGKNGEIFRMYKFRTMLPPQTLDGKILNDSERLECIKNGIPIQPDEKRLTKFGRFLRASSIDELPELFNIFIGDMSIVGPRPLAKIYLPYYTAEEMRRHEVRPGLTGLAQVNGRNLSSWEERFAYDVKYVDNITLLNDIKILFKTVAVVLAHNDIAQGNEQPEAFNVQRQRETTAKTSTFQNKNT